MRRSNWTSRRAGGFTLVEMLALILIIGIIMTIVVGVSGVIIQDANRKQTLRRMEIVLQAIRAYRDDTGDWPDNLGVLSGNTKSAKRLESLEPDARSGSNYVDGFGNMISYRKTGARDGGPLLKSNGPDGQANTDDDIRSDGG